MNAVSAIDDRTAAAIRRAIGEASAGRIASACAIGELALDEGGDEVALNAMLGMFRVRANEFELALKHLRPAHRARPSDPSIAANLIAALVECGHHQEAFETATSKLAEADATLRIARYRGYLAQLLGDQAKAIEIYGAIVSRAPDDWQSWNNLGNTRLLTGDAEGAIDALYRSLQLFPDESATWVNLAKALARAGKLDEAENELRSAADRFPRDAQPLIELHGLAKRRGRPDAELLDFLERALEREPENKSLLMVLGQQRMMAGRAGAAEAAYRAILQGNPKDSDGFIGLANVFEHSSPEKLPGLVEEARRSSAVQPTLSLLEAFEHRRAKRYAEGLKVLEAIPADFEPWIAEEMRGQFLERLGETEAAFAAFTRLNEFHSTDPSDPIRMATEHRKQVRRDLDLVTTAWLSSWKAGDIQGEPFDSPVFLVGFPRSGTTLLDTLLMGHPEVSVMEELPVLDAVERSIGGFEAVSELDEAGVRAARKLYFETAHGYVPHSRVLVDKSPLHLLRATFIHRLFPDAKFLLALRHPADVVLSCYFSNFRLTPALSNFLSLDTTAELYDLTFTSWENSRALMPLDVQSVIYEELIEHPEGQLRPVIESLGLEWHDSLLDHTATAASRGTVRTASYAQVTEPIYRSSAGRWKRYRKHLDPVLPVLRPWAEKFGYSI